MLDDVLEALEKKHASGAVHGELSLSGISIDRFGHCHARTDDAHTAAYVSGRGGTHRYAAPEVRRGGSVTATADDYAATAVFAEAVTGLPPDVAHDVITTESVGSVAAPENPVPPPLRQLVDTGMAADEARRPPNAAALRDALNTAATEAFPLVDWRARGRAWLAKGATGAPATAPAAPAVATPFRMPASAAPVTNFGPRVSTASTGAAVTRAATGGAAAAATRFGFTSATHGAASSPAAASAAGAASAGASAASSATRFPAPDPMPWQSQAPDFTPSERPRYDWEYDRLPALPGFFRRLGRGDPGIVSGCGISVIGFILLIIGVSVGMSLSGPNNAAASPANTPGVSAAQDNSSDSGPGTTPPAVGASPSPGLAGSAQVSPSPSSSGAASSPASLSPAPTDTGAPSFSPYPAFTPPPTAAPTPTPCNSILFGC